MIPTTRTVSRLLLGAAVVLVTCFGIACGEAGGGAGTNPPAPPELRLNLDAVTPAVAKAVTARRDVALRMPGDVKQWGRLGACLEVHDFFPEARTVYAYVGRLEPREWRWPYFAGMCARREDQAAAVVLFRSAIGLKEDHVPLRIQCGESLLELDRLPEAKEQFEAARRLDPRCAPAWRGLAQLSLRADQVSDARAEVNEALKLASDYKQAHLLAAEVARRENDEKASAFHRAEAERCPEESPLPDPARDQLWWQEGVTEKWRRLRALQYLKTGQQSKAVAEWSALLTVEPQNVVAKSELAIVMARGRQVEAATSLLKEAIAGGAAEIPLTLAVGAALTKAGLPNDALPLLEKVVAALPENTSARLDLGSALAMAGRFDEAVEHLKIAAEHHGSDPRVLTNLAQALGDAGRHAESAQTLERLIALVPRHPEAYDKLALARARTRDSAGAVKACREGLLADPQNGATANRLAWLLAAGPDADHRNGAEALKLATDLARATNFTDATVLDTLAAAHAEVGDFENAVKVSTRAVELAEAAVRTGKLDAGYGRRMALRLERYYRVGRAFRGPP